MKINNNTQAVLTQSILKNNEAKLATSTRKLSSGYKINAAKDNPSGMAISNKMSSKIRRLSKSGDNGNQGIDLVQIADASLSEIQDMLQRMNELSVKAANGTMTTADREAVSQEVHQLTNEITRISKTTEYNTQSLLDGSMSLKGYSSKEELSVIDYTEDFPQSDYTIEVSSDGKVTEMKDAKGNSLNFTQETITITNDSDTTTHTTTYYTTITTPNGGELTISGNSADGNIVATLNINGVGGLHLQAGSEEGQDIHIAIPKISLKTLALEKLDKNGDITSRLDYSTQDSSRECIGYVNDALAIISATRSKLGAYQNRLESAVSNNDVQEENLTKSLSTLKDLDMAEEMVQYTTNQVLVQAATSMLSQANEQPQQALQLLQ